MSDEEQRALAYRIQASRRAAFRQQLERQYTPPPGPRLAARAAWEPWLHPDFGTPLPEVPIRVPLP